MKYASGSDVNMSVKTETIAITTRRSCFLRLRSLFARLNSTKVYVIAQQAATHRKARNLKSIMRPPFSRCLVNNASLQFYVYKLDQNVIRILIVHEA